MYTASTKSVLYAANTLPGFSTLYYSKVGKIGSATFV